MQVGGFDTGGPREASNPYEPPVADDDEEDDADDDEDDADDDPDSEHTPQHWYTVPVARVLLGTLVGGWLYQTYWMYNWWSAYRISEGYSRASFWRKVREHTSFQISPTWRALLGYGYAYCVFPAVAREARHARVRGLGSPILLAVLYNLSAIVTMFVVGLTAVVVARVAAAALLVGAQLVVNRLGDRAAGATRRAPMNPAEALCLLAGAALTFVWVGMMP